MEIIKSLNETTLTIALVGRLDTTTAPELEPVLKNELGGVTKLILDFEKLDYISSAGLRIVLAAQKIMSKQGEMVVRNVCSDILEVFEITGFSDIITIEQ